MKKMFVLRFMRLINETNTEAFCSCLRWILVSGIVFFHSFTKQIRKAIITNFRIFSITRNINALNCLRNLVSLDGSYWLSKQCETDIHCITCKNASRLHSSQGNPSALKSKKRYKIVKGTVARDFRPSVFSSINPT
jgi:hypothetical protein